MNERIARAVADKGLAANLKDVFLACYDQIITRKIIRMSELIEYLDDLTWEPRLEKVARKCFQLIKELHWGIFRDLDRELHPRLWKALTVQNRVMYDVGDLKRNVLVPNVYCGLMDIHAYTEFCENHRHNFSMLRTLDDIIQKDIRQIANKNRCLSYRSAGDNIFVIGASPGAVVRSCLGIIDCFSRKRVLRTSTLSETRQGDSVVLQDIHVSAGVAGGLQYSSMVITQGGDLSGSIVNTAARLQSFASSISPTQSKVMVTAPVHSGIQKEKKREKTKPEDGIGFFSCGKIRFKGVGLSVYEVLHTNRDARKVAYQKQYQQLLETIEKSLWKERLIADLVKLVIDVIKTSPLSRMEIHFGGKKEIHTSASVVRLCDQALDLYAEKEDHREMSRRLLRILGILESASSFDSLVLAHFRDVVGLFDTMTREFESLEYEKIVTNQSSLFSIKEQKVMDDAAKLERVRATLIERGKQNNNIYSPAVLWNKVVGEYQGTWEFEIYSGKK